MPTTALSTGLLTDKHRVDCYLQRLLPGAGGAAGAVQRAMRYAVLGEAQRFRPVLALRVARLLDAESDDVLRAAGAVELLHCASLVVDDLPCMDDDEFRRDQASAHVAFGEATAVLAAFALVGLSARSVMDPSRAPSVLRRLAEFQCELLGTLDCNSLIGGQEMDLRLTGEMRDERRDLMAELKTVPLFHLAVRAGMVSASVSTGEDALLRLFGHQFGVLFQMVDDYLDDESEDMGPVNRQFDAARSTLTPFGSRSRELEGLLEYLHGRAWQKDHRHR